MKCLDTTFLIDFLKQNKDAIRKASEIEEESLCTTSINVFEFLLGSYQKEELTEIEINQLKELIKNLDVLPFDLKSSFMSSKIAADLIKRHQEISLGDSLIVGVMIANNCFEIVTRDKHFSKIKNINVITY